MKQKKLKKQKYESEDTKEIKSLIIITLIIIITAVGLYFFTDKIVNKNNDETISAEFNYTICTVGTMFNRPYDEYYVFLYDSTSENASEYATLSLNYEKKEDAIKMYTADLKNKFNSTYLSETSNPNPTTPSEVKIKESALVHIKASKVINYYETIGDYEKVLN